LGNIFGISQSFSRVEKFNLLRNNNRAFWKAPQIIIRSIEKILRGENIFCEGIKHQPIETSTIGFKIADLIFFFLVPLRYFQFIIDRFKRKLFFNQWILMFKLKNNSDLNTSFSDFVKIIPPKDRLWADPFVVFKEGEYHVYIEELLFNNGKGYISHFKIDSNGNYTKPQKIIEKEYHMSYPFLVEENGNMYMIPETSQNKTISLYKCVSFPDKWELVHHMMENIDAVDTTVFYRNNKYWMYTNIRENNGISHEDELFLFSSDSLLSQNWISHTQNPIKSDVRDARPAGNIISKNGALLRPSQNSTFHYGYGLNFFKITNIESDNYKEDVYRTIIPSWEKNIVSIHTYNQTNGLIIVDVEQRRLKIF